MMKLDTYWTTNPDWYEIIEKDNGKLVDVIKDDVLNACSHESLGNVKTNTVRSAGNPGILALK